MLRSKKVVPIPEVGGRSPGFQLPSAQGGQLELSMRTARGPVVVVFYRPWSEDDVAYFKALSQEEEEINLAAASVVGIGVAQPDEARNFVRASGIKSYVLYDYARVASREWGLLAKDEEHGEYTRPAVFIVSAEREVIHAWVGDHRPEPAEILSKVSEITGLPKPAEEGEEGEDEKPKRKPRRSAKSEESESEESKTEGEASNEGEKSAEKPSSEKPSSEEREKRRAERKAAREQGEGESGEE